jgi:microcystin-dependent protein
MPSDASGVRTLPDGYLAVTGETILASQHNPPLEDLSASMTQRLMRTGVAPMTGPLKAADGSVTAPGLTFGSATTSGLYPTADGIGVSIGGAKVAEFTSAGLKSGSRFIGELIDYTGSTAPALTVFPVGQTLSRTTYAGLWAFAQIEIAAGNTLYNNGNGSTTFGVPNKRGRVSATKDNLGGTTIGRLTNTTMSPDGVTLGAVGGSQTRTLLTANLPPYTPAGTPSIVIQGAYAIGFFTTGSPNASSASDGINNSGANVLPGTFAGTPQAAPAHLF